MTNIGGQHRLQLKLLPLKKFLDLPEPAAGLHPSSPTLEPET